MADTEKNEINWEKIFGTSMKITLPYVVGLSIGSKVINSAEWSDVLLNGVLVFCTTYGAGLTIDRIMYILQNRKAKQAENYQNNQKTH